MTDHWAVDQPRNCAVFTLRQIMDGTHPIMHVYHDSDDHGWQFLTLGDIRTEDAFVVGFEEIVALDDSLYELADLPPGWSARRLSVDDDWMREPKSEDAAE